MEFWNWQKANWSKQRVSITKISQSLVFLSLSENVCFSCCRCMLVVCRNHLKQQYTYFSCCCSCWLVACCLLFVVGAYWGYCNVFFSTALFLSRWISTHPFLDRGTWEVITWFSTSVFDDMRRMADGEFQVGDGGWDFPTTHGGKGGFLVHLSLQFMEKPGEVVDVIFSILALFFLWVSLVHLHFVFIPKLSVFTGLCWSWWVFMSNRWPCPY